MKTRVSVLLGLGAVLVLNTACGDSGFGGGGGTNKGAPARPASRDGGEISDGDDGDGSGQAGSGQAGGKNDSLSPPKDATPEQTAIGQCLKAWGNKSPFDAKVYDDFREINASVSVFGKGNAIEDTEVTTTPKLILVHAAVSVLGEANYVLMNPNGWYCFMVGVNVLAKSNVELQCTAKLADSRVNVNVGSDASATSAVGVNVFSDVKVERKQQAGGKPGC